MTSILLAPLVGLTLAAPAPAAPPTPRATLEAAVDVLDDLQQIPLKGIPKALLADAEAVVIVPRVIKAGFVIGGRSGHGVAVVKDTAGGWGTLRFVDLGGASLGFQAGVQASDVVLVFKSRRGLDRMLEGKTKLTLGADASVAAGPVGREAEAATDAKLGAEIYSYSRSRGLFAGVALNGAALTSDPRANREYRHDDGPETARAAAALRATLAEMTGGKPADRPPVRP
jgi:lipid-binding SYLF domain-containing protein